MFTFPKTTTVREIQRNYKKVFEQVKKSKEPIVVLKNNKPDVAIVDVAKLEELEAIASAQRGYIEYLQGKAKRFKSLAHIKWRSAKLFIPPNLLKTGEKYQKIFKKKL